MTQPTMVTNYQIPEVTADLIADVAKTLANSASPMNATGLAECYTGQYSPEYVRRAAIASAQLGLSELTPKGYVCSENHRDILRKTSKPELRMAFREGL